MRLYHDKFLDMLVIANFSALFLTWNQRSHPNRNLKDWSGQGTDRNQLDQLMVDSWIICTRAAFKVGTQHLTAPSS